MRWRWTISGRKGHEIRADKPRSGYGKRECVWEKGRLRTGGNIELQKNDFQRAMEVRTLITPNLFECSLYSSIFFAIHCVSSFFARICVMLTVSLIDSLAKCPFAKYVMCCSLLVLVKKLIRNQIEHVIIPLHYSSISLCYPFARK